MQTVLEISCPEVWREISELIDGTLDPEMRDRLELHLQHCVHCKAVFDGSRNAVRLIGDDRMYDLPPGFHDRLFRRLSNSMEIH